MAEGYRGSVALGIPFGPGPLGAFLALDLWHDAVALRGTRAHGSDLEMIPWQGWTLRTDKGTVHHASGGGGGRRDWMGTFLPGLPGHATEVMVMDADDERLATAPVPRPLPVGRVPTTLADTRPGRTPGCLSCGTIGEPQVTQCDLCRASAKRMQEPEDRLLAVPIRVRALSAVGIDLDIALTTLEEWSDSFDIEVASDPVGSDSPLRRLSGKELLLASSRQKMPSRWTAEDDRGRRYEGKVTGGHGGPHFRTVDVSFAPALDPAATTLTFEFRHPFGRGAWPA